MADQTSDVPGAFREFMKKANAPGALDARTKKLIAVALSTAQHCAPCLKIHVRGALDMGISKVELDEAAGLAFEFAGCPAYMLYQETCREIGV